MSLRIVGIGELAVTSDATDSLITYALGPCLGVVAYDFVRSIAGLVHCQLPLSLEDQEQAARNPARYVDTGVTHLIEKMQSLKIEFADLLKAEATSKNDLLTVFKELGYEIKL